MTHHEGHETEVTIERVGEGQQEAQPGKLGEEFKEFGSQLMRAVRAVADSDELRKLGNDIVESLKDIGEEIQETFEKARDKEEVKAVGEQAKRVSQAISSQETTGEIQSGLSAALRSLNSELNKIIDQVQARSARAGEAVDGTAREAEAQKEQKDQFEQAMDDTLEESAAEDSKQPGPEHESKETLASEWHEETQPGADLTDEGGRTDG